MAFNALWWWIDRWRKSTAYTDMTLEEQGAYRNLLDEAQLRGGPLPFDERTLARACGDPLSWKRVKPKVMRHFHRAEDGWRNDTLDEVMKESARRAAKQARYRERNKRGHTKGHETGNAPIDNGGNNRGSPYPSPSPGTSSDDDVTPRARGTSLGRGLLKPHGHVAFDSPRVWVPWQLHLQLLGLRNNAHAEEELQAFYQHTADAWTTGERAADNIEPEMFTFWRARYAEHWPPSDAPNHGSKGPAWLAKARAKA